MVVIHSGHILRWRHQTIDLIHDARHLCTPVEIDGIKAMSRGFSGGKQLIKAANTSNRGRIYLFPQNDKTI